MSSPIPAGRIRSTLRHFLDNEASGGLVLMAVALAAIVTANSPCRGLLSSSARLYRAAQPTALDK